MSEKLKEIKRLWHEEDTLDFDSYDWLIKQAERVQELEMKNDTWKTETYKKTVEWKRYKRALEELRQMSLNVSVEREEDGSIIPNHEAQLIFEITNKALGGNENE